MTQQPCGTGVPVKLSSSSDAKYTVKDLPQRALLPARFCKSSALSRTTSPAAVEVNSGSLPLDRVCPSTGVPSFSNLIRGLNSSPVSVHSAPREPYSVSLTTQAVSAVRPATLPSTTIDLPSSYQRVRVPLRSVSAVVALNSQIPLSQKPVEKASYGTSIFHGLQLGLGRLWADATLAMARAVKVGLLSILFSDEFKISKSRFLSPL